MKIVNQWIALGLLAAAALPGATIRHQGLDAERSLTFEMSANGTTRNVTAGVGRILVDGIRTLDVFCVDLFTLISVGVDYNAMSVSTSTFDAEDGNRAAWLMGTFLPQINLLANGDQKKQWGAALQFAIWDVIHDSGDGFGAGLIRSTGNTNAAVLNQANSWIAASLNQSREGKVFVAPPEARDFQEQMYLAPEPSALAMMLIGVAAVAIGSFRRRGKDRATRES